MPLLKRSPEKEKAAPAAETPVSSPTAHHAPSHVVMGVLKRPHLSEKAHGLSALNQYVFVVRDSANKRLVKEAIEHRYHVSVEAVNIVRVRGKSKRWRNVRGHRSGIKKAVITVRAGQKIEIA
ncbi:MAG: 50S ribosomal protein L23 [Patescibacteria group bacterium]